MGAWIETFRGYRGRKCAPSHPTWVRGLKRNFKPHSSCFPRSHPTWVRGLKHIYYLDIPNDNYVAPYMGAWIETLLVRL